MDKLTHVVRKGDYIVIEPKKRAFPLAWIGTFASLCGAVLVASGNFLIGYILFAIGAILWYYVGYRSKDTPLMVLNFAYLCINLYGLLNLGV